MKTKEKATKERRKKGKDRPLHNPEQPNKETGKKKKRKKGKNAIYHPKGYQP
jgi:hypothetical protein